MKHTILACLCALACVSAISTAAKATEYQLILVVVAAFVPQNVNLNAQPLAMPVGKFSSQSDCQNAATNPFFFTPGPPHGLGQMFGYGFFCVQSAD